MAFDSKNWMNTLLGVSVTLIPHSSCVDPNEAPDMVGFFFCILALKWHELTFEGPPYFFVKLFIEIPFIVVDKNSWYLLNQ